MLAIRKTSATRGISLDEVPEPGAPGPDEVIVEVGAAGICGSDVHVYEWSSGYEFMQGSLPVVLGHEFAGTVAAVGERVSGLRPGELVTAMPGVTCMRCEACVQGRTHMCPHRETLGLTLDGAFARRVRVPAMNCLPLRPGTELALAALIEPLCVGDNASEVGEVTSGDTVLVLGPGTIGQAIVRTARWRGATRVIAVGMNDSARLQVARAMGATHCIDLADGETLQQGVHRITGGAPVDVVIEATGHSSSIPDGLQVLRKGGIMVTAGIHSRPVSFDLTRMIRHKQQLRGAHGSRRHAWERMVQRIADEPEAVRPMVSLQLGLRQAEEGFRQSLTRAMSKVILIPE